MNTQASDKADLTHYQHQWGSRETTTTPPVRPVRCAANKPETSRWNEGVVVRNPPKERRGKKVVVEAQVRVEGMKGRCSRWKRAPWTRSHLSLSGELIRCREGGFHNGVRYSRSQSGVQGSTGTRGPSSTFLLPLYINIDYISHQTEIRKGTHISLPTGLQCNSRQHWSREPFSFKEERTLFASSIFLDILGAGFMGVQN